MKLSNLVSVRNRLREHNRDRQAYSDFMTRANYSLQTTLALPSIREIHEVSQARQLRDLDQSLQNWYDSVDRIVDDINREIDTHSQRYMSESEKLWFRNPKDREILPLSCEAEDRRYIKERCELYNDWRFPGVLFGATDQYIIQALTGLDPLYIVDTSHDRIDNTIEQFNERYRYRVRKYINKRTDQLAKLPENQIGFIISYNWLNHQPWSQIRAALDRAQELLRPGGTLAFTYNDCDNHYGVLWFESQGTVSYVTGTMIRNYAISRGWHIVNDWTDGINLHWLELRKEGELSTTRAGQTLAKIHADPESVKKYIEQQRVSEREALKRQQELEKLFKELDAKQQVEAAAAARAEYEKLIIRALELNISDPRAYEPGKLRRIVERREIIARNNKHPLPKR